MRVVAITNQIALKYLIERVTNKSTTENFFFEFCDTVGSVLRTLDKELPSAVILDGDSALSRDQILLQKLCNTQVAGVKIILLRTGSAQSSYPEIPYNSDLDKAQITSLSKIITETVKKG